MSLAGTTFDMIRRSNQNRQQLKQRQQKRRDMRMRYVDALTRGQAMHPHEELSPAEIARIKRDIRETMQKEKQRKIFLSIVVFGVSVFLTIYVFKILIMFLFQNIR